MEYPFLRERNLDPSLTQWYVYFSSDLIQIKVIAQTLGGGYVQILEKCFFKYYKKGGKCNTIKKEGNVISVKM